MIRLGLCCCFSDEPIRFSTTTAAAISRLARQAALEKLGNLALANAHSLIAALSYCSENGIGCFRVLSQILPLKTHPTHGYEIADLPQGKEIKLLFLQAGAFAGKLGIRTCFHPDQFVVLNSPKPEVVNASIRELEYQAEVAEWIGADVINIHGGGAFGDKPRALDAFAQCLQRLSPAVRKRLTLENDDRIYSPSDLLPLCQSYQIPLVYDVHHHRCHPDNLRVEEATKQAIATWNREPLFHISSPCEGWKGPKPQRHHDYINISDFPRCWLKHNLTVEVEARAKEKAVLKLSSQLTVRKIQVATH
ncbi:MAG: UV DNA damage repair endonuclease UvsE [Planctomycetia bacterium]|nr:UV DNA damage repair endonuclease UvsE [Planctomycetia bacterium]